MSDWLSITGLYNYRDDIFDLMELPAVSDLPQDLEYITPIEPLDRDLVINNILFELAELELLYPDADFIKAQIGLWSRIEKRIVRDMWATLLYKYNPIWNKDGKIVEERDINRSGEDNRSGTESSTTGTSDSRTGKITDAGTTTDNMTENSRVNRDETTLHKVTGFDSDTLSDSTSDVFDADNTSNTTSAGTGTSSNVRDITDTASGTTTVNGSTTSAGNRTETENERYTRIEQGNIGVTTTQAMIREQREIVSFNIYKYITESFKQRFCVLIY